VAREGQFLLQKLSPNDHPFRRHIDNSRIGPMNSNGGLDSVTGTVPTAINSGGLQMLFAVAFRMPPNNPDFPTGHTLKLNPQIHLVDSLRFGNRPRSKSLLGHNLKTL